MTLSDSDKTDRLFKGSQGREMTSTDKAYYEEGAGNLRVVLGEEVWLEDINSNPTTAISDGTIWMQSGWMIEDTTVANQKSWYASGQNIGYWKGWVPPKIAQVYTIKIYQSGSGDGNLGDKLSDADMGTLGGVFDYQAGIFWMNTSPSSYDYPFYISGYMYSGKKAYKVDLDKLYQASGTGGGSAWSGASGYLIVSGNARDAYNWVNASSQRYEDILSSGVKYTLAYNWFTESSSRLSDFYNSGDEYSSAYQSGQRVKDLFNHTLYSLSSNLYNQTWIDALSGSIDARLDALEGQEITSWSGATGFYTVSSNYYGHSSNGDIHTKTKMGWASVAHNGTIAHGLGSKPSYVSITPSGGSVNFGINTTVDDTEITVYLTAPGSRNVNWIVEV